SEATVVVFAVPSSTLDENVERYAGWLSAYCSVVSAIKGLEPESGRRMSELITAAGIEQDRVLALSGPNFATEIVRGLPAATVVAGEQWRANRVQASLAGPAFRVYTSDDVAGVE